MSIPDPRYPQSQQPMPPPPPVQGEQTYVQSGTGGPAGGDPYVESRHENYVTPTGDQIERREEVYDNPELRRANARYWTTTTVYFVLAVLEVILGLRFLFRLLGANSYSGFVAGLYAFSHPFIAPFVGIFGEPALKQTYVFEVSTLVAMLIYALIAWGIVSLARIMLGSAPASRRTFTMERRRRV